MREIPARCPAERLVQIARGVCHAWPPDKWTDSDSLVAVSGGCDSVGLLRVLLHVHQQSAGSGRLIVTHFNHETGEQSDRHADFVRKLSAQWDLPYYCIHRSEMLPATSATSELALRELRFAALFQVAKQSGARNIVTGHTADDQIETVLFRLFRGTGMAGLQGIPAVRVRGDISIVRPLLAIRRDDLIDMLRELDQPWETDLSNLNSDYTRNFLRNEIIPLIAERFGEQYAHSIIRLGQQAREHDLFLDQLTVSHESQAVLKPYRIEIPLPAAAGLHLVLQRHLLKRLWRAGDFPEQEMNQASWWRLADLLTAEPGTIRQFPGKVQACREPDRLVILRLGNCCSDSRR